MGKIISWLFSLSAGQSVLLVMLILGVLTFIFGILVSLVEAYISYTSKLQRGYHARFKLFADRVPDDMLYADIMLSGGTVLLILFLITIVVLAILGTI